MEDIAESTGHEWLKMFPDFRSAVQRARAKQSASLVKIIRKAAIEGITVTVTKTRIGDSSFEEITETRDGNSRVDYAKWLLSRLEPEEYADQYRIEQAAEKIAAERLQAILDNIDEHSKAQVDAAIVKNSLRLRIKADSEIPS
jgi:hypothetical protein